MLVHCFGSLEIIDVFLSITKYGKYGSKAKLLFTDTDSLNYFVEIEDIYQDMMMESDLYGFSTYPPTHPWFSLLNEKSLKENKGRVPQRPTT